MAVSPTQSEIDKLASAAAIIDEPLPEGDGNYSRTVFEIQTFQDVLSRPPKKYLVEGILGERDQVMVYGPPKSGKTFVVLDLCASIITGSVFADRFEVKRPSRVLYCYGEGRSGMPTRLQSLHRDRQFSPDDQSRFLALPLVPQLFDPESPEHVSKLVAYLASLSRYRDWLEDGLLVIDTFSRATRGANENHASDTSTIFSALDSAQRQLKCATLCVHHASYGGNARGSTNIPASFDALYHVRRDGGGRVFGCEMAKDAPEIENLSFSLPLTQWEDGAGNKHESCTVSWLGVAHSSRARERGWKEELIEVLRMHCRNEIGAKTAVDIAPLVKRGPTAKSVRDFLAPLSETSTSGVNSVIQPSRKADGKPGKTAQHFYWDTKFDEGEGEQ